MAASFTIIPANLSHLDVIEAIEQDCFKSPWNRDALRSELSGLSWSRTFLAMKNNTPAGYINFWTVCGEYQILKVAVHSSFRGQRAGVQMIEHLKALAMEEHVSLISLELRAQNTIAQRLYESCGFCTAGTRKGYYTDTGEDAILMNYELND